MTGTFQLQQVTVRMYRPGLGDCFLLTFKSSSNECRYMLIDCGVLQKTADQEPRLEKIIQDIKEQTGGSAGGRGELHIVAATHEHADHLSGFVIHKNKFKNDFNIEEVWLAWTENKQDSQVADVYSSLRDIPLEALKEALSRYDDVPDSDIPQSIKNIKKLYEFVSDGGMDSLRSMGGKLQYLSPNTDPELGPTNIITREDFGGVRFHVLGPPEDPAFLKKGDLPKNKNQIYRGEPINQATAFTSALLKWKSSGRAAARSMSELEVEELYELCLPFNHSLSIPVGKVKKDKFFIEHYGFSENRGDEAPAWRRIDDDWLEAGTQLALDLDDQTNNTSLVLAIELPGGGKVLLFPGDAQHGNWLSWAKTPNGADLLRRTVFYKVGHHGSNNATLVPGGLDQMLDPALVAMIPVDPVRQPNYKMPNQALKTRLLAQARGRVIVACEGTSSAEPCPCVDFKPPAEKPAGMSVAEWEQFNQSLVWDKSTDKLWIEYTLST
jgi:hypothetical protein